MARKAVLIALVAAIFLATTGCMIHTHTVGAGSRGMGLPLNAKQWYILWGLVRLNNVDSKFLAGEAADYTVRTRVSFLDGVLNVLFYTFTTGFLSLRSVEVYR